MARGEGGAEKVTGAEGTREAVGSAVRLTALLRTGEIEVTPEGVIAGLAPEDGVIERVTGGVGVIDMEVPPLPPPPPVDAGVGVIDMEVPPLPPPPLKVGVGAVVGVGEGVGAVTQILEPGCDTRPFEQAVQPATVGACGAPAVFAGQGVQPAAALEP